MSATPHSITQPLHLRGYLRTAPRAGWDFIAVLDILLLIGLLLLHHSRFVFGSGAEIELVRGQPGMLAIPSDTAVLTVRANHMMFFDGQKVAPERLAEALGGYADEHPGEATLLLKVDRTISLQELFGLFETARLAGFARVQIASEPTVEDRFVWPDR
jgi:biopolymer transport protein ExbD